MTARATTVPPASPMRAATRLPGLAAALGFASALGFALAAAGTARADTPAPQHPPAPISVTTPPPPEIAGGGAPSTVRASGLPAQARAPLPAASSAASALGLSVARVTGDDSAASDAPEVRNGEPHVEHLVTEDGSVRIEEERVRSQTTRIVVKSKIPGMGSYEIAPQDLSRDPTTDTKAGKRIWLSIGF